MHKNILLQKQAFTVSFSGHRKLKSQATVLEATKKEVIRLIENGAINFLNGMALGYDLETAQLILDLKKSYSYIRLIAVLPCLPEIQTKFWKADDKTFYKKILSQVDEVITVSDFYYNGCMLARNRYMINNSSVLVCYLTEQTGGTAYTVRYGEEKKLKIINIAR